MRGFILTRQWRDTPEGVSLEMWLAGEQGPIRLLVPEQFSVCFFRESDLPLVKKVTSRFPSVSYRPVELKNIHNDSVMALYCSGQRQLREVGELLNIEGVHLWEQDIKPVERFLMERFVTASLEFHDENANLIDQSFLSATTKRIRPCNYQPNLTVVSLDIETSLDGKALYSIAVYNLQHAIIFMVDSSRRRVESEMVDGMQLCWCPSEKVCLRQFLQWFKQVDPDVIIGWHVVQFDLWVLQTICDHWQVDFALGRAQQKIHWREDGQNSERRYAQVPGRIVLDGIELLRTAFYNFDSFSLQFVASELLGESKLLEHDNRSEAITDLFAINKVALAAYNLQDCKLVWNIFEKTKLLHFAIERSRLTGMAMDRMGGSVASFEYAYLPRLHRAGYVAPNLGELESDIVSPGGYVMRSKPGLYKNVLVLDFKSLYPSIIRTFTIDPYAFWVAKHNDLLESETVPGFNGARFSRKDFILPNIIDDLWQSRDVAKAENNKPLSHAIKIIMNSFYGVLGSTGCRFYDPRVCSSITLRGHEIIQSTRDRIVEKGYDVIYGDTDSVFVWLGNDVESDQADEIGQELACDLNNWWRLRLKKQFAIDTALELEFETHYSHFLMPTIRGSTKGSKKRYAGIVNSSVDGQIREELIFKGLETVRTDWTGLAKQFQQELYYKVFRGEPYEGYICQIVNDLVSGKLDDQLIYKKKLRRPLHGYEKSNPPHVKAARKLSELSGKLLGRGDAISYVITINGPEPLDYQSSLTDYQHYVDKQLKPIADSILVFLNDRFEKIVDQQMLLI